MSDGSSIAVVALVGALVGFTLGAAFERGQGKIKLEAQADISLEQRCTAAAVLRIINDTQDVTPELKGILIRTMKETCPEIYGDKK